MLILFSEYSSKLLALRQWLSGVQSVHGTFFSAYHVDGEQANRGSRISHLLQTTGSSCALDLVSSAPAVPTMRVCLASQRAVAIQRLSTSREGQCADCRPPSIAPGPTQSKAKQMTSDRLSRWVLRTSYSNSLSPESVGLPHTPARAAEVDLVSEWRALVPISINSNTAVVLGASCLIRRAGCRGPGPMAPGTWPANLTYRRPDRTRCFLF